MELEHLLHHSGWHLILQMLMGSLMIPAIMGRGDLYRTFIRTTASHVVSFGPLALLVYVLYEVSRLS
jgi:hypothetical protein